MKDSATQPRVGSCGSHTVIHTGIHNHHYFHDCTSSCDKSANSVAEVRVGGENRYAWYGYVDSKGRLRQAKHSSFMGFDPVRRFVTLVLSVTVRDIRNLP